MCSVPSRADALRPRRAGDRRADRLRPRARHRGEHAGVGNARAAERAAKRSVEPFHQPGSTRPGVTTRSCAGASGSASAPVAVTSVWPRRAEAVAEDAAAVGVELRQGVVEQEERRHADLRGEQLGLGEEERQDGHPLLALRPVGPQIAVAGEDPDLVEVRAEPGGAALEVARRGARRARPGTAGRRRRPSDADSSPSSPARSAKAGSSSASTRARASTSCAASATTWPVHGSSAEASETPAATRRSAALRCPSAAAYAVGTSARAGSTRASTRSKYARRVAGPPLTTASRSGVNASAWMRERSSSADASAAPFQRIRFGSRTETPHLGRRPRPRRGAPSTRARPSSGAATDDLRVLARPERERPVSRRARPRAGSSCPRRFGPVTRTSPGSSASSSRAYERTSRSDTCVHDQLSGVSRRSPALLAGEPDRHDQVPEGVALGAQQARAGAG